MTRRRLTSLTPRLARLDLRTAPPAPKRADAELLTPEHRAWANVVCSRAGWQCEKIEHGERCPRGRATGHQVYADHIKERRDGGALYDPANGQCRCASHHTLKTHAARLARLAAPAAGGSGQP